MTEQMIQTVHNRMNEMLQDSQIKAHLNTFPTKDEAHNYLIKAAIATLIIPISQR